MIPQLGVDGLLAGNGVAQIGQSETLGPLPGGGFSAKVDLIRAQGGSDALALVNTIALTIAREGNIDLGLDNQTPPVKAVITAGQGGSSAMVFEVDFINGMVLSVPASSLSLSALIDTDTMDAFDVPVRVSAFVTYLPRPGSTPVRRTLRTGPMGIGAAVVQDLPKFATSLQLMATTAAATFTVQQYRDKLLTQLVAVTTLAVAPPYQEIPIAQDTRYVNIINTTGGVLANVQALYRLAL